MADNYDNDLNIVETDKNSVFKRYDSEQHLKFNQEYEFSANIQGEIHTVKFTSKYSPMYSTAKLIRSDLLEMLDEISDDVINFTIWQNSIMANEIAATKFKEDKIPFEAKQYVRLKTEIDLIHGLYLCISGNFGSTSKRIGSIEIKKEYRVPYLKDMLGKIKDELRPFENKLIGVKVLAKAATRAGSHKYPIVDRRSF